MPKSIYLNDAVLKQINDVKEFFSKVNYEPTDSGIISASLTVYKKMLETDAHGLAKSENERNSDKAIETIEQEK